MRQIILWTMMWSGILLFIGCGGANTSQNQEQTKGKMTTLKLVFNNNVNKSVTRVINGEVQKASSAIKRVSLDVSHTDSTSGNIVVDVYNKAMSQVNQEWQTNLLLDSNNTPFTATARAYDSLSGGNLIFRGTGIITNLLSGVQAVVINMEPVGDLNRTIPWVKSINYTDINSTRKKVSFTILDETAEDLEYIITPVAGSFSPNKGTLTFPPKSMVLDSNYSNILGGLPTGNIQLKNPRGDIFQYNFTGSNSQLVLNTPPNINNIKMIVDKTDVTVTANVDDLENDTISKKWRLVKGQASEVLGTSTADTYMLENYVEGTEICVALKATDGRGASSEVQYCLLSSGGATNNSYPSYPTKVFKTGQTTVYQAKDDGYYQSGVAHNFMRNSNNTVTDYEQNLTWQDDRNISADLTDYNVDLSFWKTWADANKTCADSNLSGFTDWRLPTIDELRNVLDKSKSTSSQKVGNNSAFNQIFESIYPYPRSGSGEEASWYWSSNQNRYIADQKWSISSNDGHMRTPSSTSKGLWMCVRDGIN